MVVTSHSCPCEVVVDGRRRDTEDPRPGVPASRAPPPLFGSTTGFRRGSSKLTCTRLVTQTDEHLDDVVGNGGFGVELLTAELDGDLLQWA